MTKAHTWRQWVRPRLALAWVLPLLASGVPALVQGQFLYTTNSRSLTVVKCTGILTEVAIPSAVYSMPVVAIAATAFRDNTTLTRVLVPHSITNIGEPPFWNCPSLAAIQVSPGNPAYSSLDGILFNKNLTALLQYPAALEGSTYTVPESVTRIAPGAFNACTKLTSITSPNALIDIGEHAFAYCAGLTNITFHSGVAAVGSYSFIYCTNLAAVCVGGNVPTDGDLLFFNDNEAVVYRLPGTIGWGPTFGGRPTALWLPTIQTSDAAFGILNNQFGFTINWASGMTNVIEACTNLGNPSWSAIVTNVVSNDGTAQFTDPDWANYPARFYRVRP